MSVEPTGPATPSGHASVDALAGAFARLDAAARADSAVGTPQRIGERVLIPLAEVFYGGGFGLGEGDVVQGPGAPHSGMGGGGGFGGRVRPVAVIEVDEGGVRVRPVFDASAIGLALVTVGLAALIRLARRP